MGMRIAVLLMLLAIGLGVVACGARRTEVYLWPPAADVADQSPSGKFMKDYIAFVASAGLTQGV